MFVPRLTPNSGYEKGAVRKLLTSPRTIGKNIKKGTRR
jgi:hypothetical protein